MVGLLIRGGGHEPGQGDHPLLHRLWRHAIRDTRTVWRLHYKIPRTDPRFLELTEQEAAMDLAEVAFYEGHHRPRDEERGPPDDDERRKRAADFAALMRSRDWKGMIKRTVGLASGKPAGKRWGRLKV